MEPNWNGNLSLKINTTLFKRKGHGFFINAFQEAETKFVVYVVEDASDSFG